MMAHYNGDIVTIREIPSKKAMRGYDHSRVGNISTETVYLPFDSEYGLGFKFTDGYRRRLEVWIDGTQVVQDLIIEGEEVLERFMDTNKRFKFVPATSEGVGDPTNSKNGNIEIRLYRELVPVVKPQPVYRTKSAPSGAWGGALRGQSLGEDLRLGSRSIHPQGMVLFGYANSPSNQIQCSAESYSGSTGDLCCSVGASASMCDTDSITTNYGVNWNEIQNQQTSLTSAVGATVEGSTSGQTFGTTTWRGDLGIPNVFIFNLRGRVAVKPRKAIQCPYCNTYNREDASTCTECGAMFC